MNHWLVACDEKINDVIKDYMCKVFSFVVMKLKILNDSIDHAAPGKLDS